MDIRVYKSDIPNIDYNSTPSNVNNKKLLIIVHRIVMKLREKEFSLGDFDHLYLNLTTCLESGAIEPAKRSVDRYHPWYRFYDVGVDESFYNALDTEQAVDKIIAILEEVLLQYFAENESEKEMIRESIREAVTQKENMLMRFKVKETATRKAVVYMRWLDCLRYAPLLCVYDAEGNELLRKELALISDFDAFGTIQLSNKKVTIKPRTNVFTKHLKPISFEF